MFRRHDFPWKCAWGLSPRGSPRGCKSRAQCLVSFSETQTLEPSQQSPMQAPPRLQSPHLTTWPAAIRPRVSRPVPRRTQGPLKSSWCWTPSGLNGSGFRIQGFGFLVQGLRTFSGFRTPRRLGGQPAAASSKERAGRWIAPSFGRWNY